MDKPERSAALSWFWVIEYVASLPEINPSILHGLIDHAPKLPDDLGKETRERVALRCMEHLFGSRNEVESNVNVPSTAKPKVTFDISRSCEDVLLSILKEEPNLDSRTGLKWDVQPFILHKKSSLPKCSLKRLKDELLEGAHLCVESLIGPSGLMHKDEDSGCRIDNAETSNAKVMAQGGNTISLPLENNYRSLGDDSNERISLPMKRNGNFVDSENQADYQKDQGDGDPCLNVKRFKCNASSVNEATEQILSPRFDNEFVEESCKRMTETTEKETPHAERESRVEGLGGCVSSKNGHEKFVATDRIVRTVDAIYENKHNQCGNADDAAKMPLDAFEDGQCQDIMAGEVNEAETRNGTFSRRILQKVSVDDSRDVGTYGNQQKSPIDVASEDSSEHLYEEDRSTNVDEYHHEKVDVAMKKSQFLSSQCTLHHVSLSHSTELYLCVKCSEDDKLFVCNVVGCPIVVHEKCLGCSPRFDNKGNFYCPFCSYSYAISKYMEAKARAASAGDELARFIHKVRCRSDSKQLEKRKAENKFEEPGVIHGMSHISPAEKESEGMTPEHLSVRGLDRHDHVSFDPKSNIAKQLSRDKEVFLNEKEGEGGIQKRVFGKQSNDLSTKPVRAVNSDGGKITNVKSKEYRVSNYSLRLQGKKKAMCLSRNISVDEAKKITMDH